VSRSIEAAGAEMGVEVLALGGMEDHIHLLVRLSAIRALADVVKQVKSASSHLATHAVAPDKCFKWQGASAAFSLSQGDLAAILAYSHNQQDHHRFGSLFPEGEDEDLSTLDSAA